MGTFAYKAIDESGLYKRGIVEADDLEAAHNDPSLQGLNVLSIAKAGRLSAGVSKGLVSLRIKRSAILEFATNLSVIMGAGIPILDALNDIGQITDNKYLREAVDDIREKIQSGLSFSSALSFHRRIFPDIMVRLITIGEETGRLEQSIKEVAEHLQRMEDLSRMVKRALMYPVFALITTGGALGFWIFYVLPQIMVVMKDMNVELPVVTRILIAVSDNAREYWYLLILAPIALVVIYVFMKRRKETRYLIDYVKMKLPILKLFVVNRLFAVFCEQMRILIVAGITIDRSLVIVANAVGSEVFKKVLLEAREEVMTGSRISDAFRQHSFFHPLVVRMVDIGEMSGNLDNQFDYLSRLFYRKLEDVTDKLGKMIEPLLLLFVGGIFAVIIIGLLLPIYDIVTKIDR